MEVQSLMKQGAEAKIYKTEFLGKQAIIKERFPKRYRHPTLDATICKERTRMEARSLIRCRTVGIPTPAVYFVDCHSNRIYMEYMEGSVTVKEYITQIDNGSKLDKWLPEKIGRILAALHNADIIHGDLTTSNMLLRHLPYDDTSLVILIDFGLSYVQASAEDKAVDMYVLERAFLSTHPTLQDLFQVILDEYFAHCKNAKDIHKKLDEVRLRGRKRTMVG